MTVTGSFESLAIFQNFFEDLIVFTAVFFSLSMLYGIIGTVLQIDQWRHRYARDVTPLIFPDALTPYL